MKKQLKKTAKNAPENLFDSTLLPNQHCRCSLAIILSSRPPYKAYNLGLQTVVFTIILSQSHSAAVRIGSSTTNPYPASLCRHGSEILFSEYPIHNAMGSTVDTH